jgi:hypothetical protein
VDGDMKPKRFFFHYHKAESCKQGRNVLTMHWQNACHPVHHIKTHGVDIETHAQKHQPRCIMRGWAKEVSFAYGTKGITAHIYG